MERKGIRNLSSASGLLAKTTAGLDSKKDGIKQWPRGCRRREPTGSTSQIKPEQCRKPQPQRVKASDKRPKPRNNGNNVVRDETSWLNEEQEVELGSVFLPGSKKQSLNHLLNFSYGNRDNVESYKKNNVRGGKGLGTKKHKFNKEHFLQANCQFIVNEFGDYKRYLNDPDALVNWDLIEQINLQVNECPSCPICLYPPIAAKMTRCGHIYCWSCILHYLSLSDKPTRNCPICFDSVHRNDLKSVVAIAHPTYNVNETITFKLMKRLKGSLISYPAYAKIEENDTIFDMSNEKINQIHSKLLLAKRCNVLSIIGREENELKCQMNEEGDSPEKCFIDEALVLLKTRETQICEDIERKIEKIVQNDVKVTEDVKYHYFYQASDGQHIYLHALNIKMLEHTYGSLENSPEILTGSILEKEGGSMTEELRKRLRYLQHLPLTCQFEVAEIQLKQPIVSKETLDQFKDQIEMRKKKRNKRAKEEKRREKRIEVEELKQIGKYPIPDLHLESNIQFPEFNRFRSESESTFFSEENSIISPENSLENSHAGPSFAKMLAMEKKQQPVSWPTLKPKEEKLVTVTGKNMKLISTNKIESDNEDFEAIPSFNNSFGDVLAQALEKVNIEKDDDQSFGKKKYFSKMKKKPKQKVLFATTIAYSEK